MPKRHVYSGEKAADEGFQTVSEGVREIGFNFLFLVGYKTTRQPE